MSIQKITAKDIKDFLNDNVSYSESTLKKIYQLLGQTFRRAIERNYIIRNPITFEEARKPKSSKENSKVEALTINEEKKLGHKNIQTTLDTYASVFDKFEDTEEDKILDYLEKNEIGLH